MEDQLKITDKRVGMDVSTEVNTQEESSINSVIMMAMEKKYTPEFIEKMMDLAERNEKNIAKKAFNKALARFKANPPKIWRDLQVKYEVGNKITAWSHSDLGKASEAINKRLGEENINSTWRTEQKDTLITVTCILTHELGHSESTSLYAPPDVSGSKNAIQAIGSTIFYLERYTLFAITGLAPISMDNDGGGPVKYISDKQLNTIKDYIDNYDVDEMKFLKYLKVETLEEIPENKYKTAIASLEAKKKQKEGVNDDN